MDGNANSPTQLSNLTVSSNEANVSGGGVYVEGAADIAHSTIAFNRSDADESGDGAGGGVYSSRGNANLNHTIVAGNIDSSGTAPDVAGVINSNFSLVGIGAEFLAPLADNGGPTPTHALLPAVRRLTRATSARSRVRTVFLSLINVARGLIAL